MSVAVAGSVIARVLQYGRQEPANVALRSGGETVTYGELSARVRHAADRLRQLGVGSGSRIGIAVPRSTSTVVTVLAAHLCGAAYVPFDEQQPDARLRAIADLADVDLIILGEDSCEAVEQARRWSSTSRIIGYHTLLSDTHGVDRSDAGLTNAEDVRLGDMPAYIMFTSGSTGEPKGVIVTHDNLAALMKGWTSMMGCREHVSLWLSALSFDASVAEIFWPLFVGGQLAIAPPAAGAGGSADSIGRVIERHDVTHLQCTPTRATLLLADHHDRAALVHLEHLVVGGEALPTALAMELLDAGVKRLTNAYGPTEATVWATAGDVVRENLQGAVVSLGRPLPGVVVSVVDENGADVSCGVTGELVISGPYVAGGYLKRPDLTTEKFHMRAGRSGVERAYSTGDLAAIGPDGTVTFHGRSDAQVKVRGHRIELGEIEAVLGSHPSVQHAVVDLDRRHVAAGQPATELIAAVALARQAEQAERDGANGADAVSAGEDPRRINNPELAEDLRSHLVTRLPAVMVPQSVVLFNILPLTTSGKLDRVGVRQLLGGERDRLRVESTTDELAALIEDFRVVLPSREAHRIDADADFFDCGGHSILAVELVSRIVARTSATLSLSALVDAPTPALLHDLLAAQRARHGGDGPSRYNPLVPLAPRHESSSVTPRPRPRLYFIHGAGGHVLRYQPMAALLADDVEVIGIQAIGTEGTDQPDPTLDSMVDRYARAIEEALHGGSTTASISIGGYSDGGILAVHVADRLLDRGIAVTSLVMVDSFRALPFPASPQQKLGHVLYNVTHRDGLGLLQWLRGAVTGWKRRGDWDRAGVEALRKLGINDVFAAIEQSVLSGRPAPNVNVPLLLLRTYTENPIRRRDYSAAYRSPSSTTVRWVEGKHDELFHDFSTPQIARHIRAFLCRQ
jgi:amino acid adenylation domain-containing protein